MGAASLEDRVDGLFASTWAPTPTIPPLKAAAAAAVGGDHPHVVTATSTTSSTEVVEPGVVQLMEADTERLEWWEEWANISDHNGTLASSGGSHAGGNWTVVDGLAESDANASIQFLLSTMTAIVLGVMILATIVGNVFVIAAILLERNLQSVANYLILSLAVADLLVAALVMPLGAVYEVSKEWTLGPELCDMWTASDVLCCTASILHLVAIALDRFWAVTNVDYIHHRSPKRVGGMIAVIWSVSFLISAAPMMGWKDPEWHERLRNKMCIISQDVGYQIFATITSFYFPLFVILVLYWRVYQAARKRIRRRIGTNAHTALCRGPITISETTTFTRMSSQPSPEKTSNGSTLNGHPIDSREDSSAMGHSAISPVVAPHQIRRREGELRKERKAAKTLGIITGAFVICWLPFFILAVLMPLCTLSCDFNPYLIATFLWLGYFNSTLNPIIYTVFSPEFRNAFKRILCGRKRMLQRHSSRFSSVRFNRS